MFSFSQQRENVAERNQGDRKMSITLLDTQQAADRLTVTPRTLVDWRSTGKHSLSYVKIGRKIRYTEAAIHSFIESNTVKYNQAD